MVYAASRLGGLGSSLPVMLFELNRGRCLIEECSRSVLYQWAQRATCHSTSRRSVQAGPGRLNLLCVVKPPGACLRRR